MDQYDILLDNVMNYKDREIILNHDNQISAYDFYHFLMDEFKELGEMRFNCEELINQINKSYSLKQLIERKIMDVESINKEIKDIWVCSDASFSYLYLLFSNYFGIPNDNNYVMIAKNRDSNQLYIKEGFCNDEIIKNNYEKMLEILAISEYYSDTFGDAYNDLSYPMIAFDFEDDVFSLRINCDIDGNVDARLYMVSDKNNYIERIWIRDNAKYLSMIIDEDKFMFMKRFKINISMLDPSFQSLIFKHRENGISHVQEGLHKALKK